MSGRRLDVQVCLLNATTRRYGPHPTSDLLGVDYRMAVPPDTEFPRVVPRLDLFVRFVVAGVGPTEIEIRVIRLDDDGSVRERVSSFRHTVPFAPTERVREHSFRLANVRLTGEGLYAVRIGRRVRAGWRGVRWRTLGSDYFYVVR
jgi:hypothetical protein